MVCQEKCIGREDGEDVAAAGLLLFRKIICQGINILLRQAIPEGRHFRVWIVCLGIFDLLNDVIAGAPAADSTQIRADGASFAVDCVAVNARFLLDQPGAAGA